MSKKEQYDTGPIRCFRITWDSFLIQSIAKQVPTTILVREPPMTSKLAYDLAVTVEIVENIK